MNRNRITAIVAVAAIALAANAFVVDWDKIVYWTGEGTNRAALVVQFADDGPEEAYVWGYRWKDGQTPSGEDMFRAVAEASSDLTLFTQYTGWMGSTVCGIGYSRNHEISDFLEYDFAGAKDDPNISFNYFSANTSMGQTSVPGWDTQDLCDEAIAASKTSHVIEHPINQHAYGYPAYDYDWWQAFDRTDAAAQRWNAGWYAGYWSYWVGGVDSDDFSYSGLGMTSRKLNNGDVDGWKYQFLDGPVTGADATTGASTPWHELNYDHFGSASVASLPQAAKTVEVYNLQGVKVAAGLSEEALLGKLPQGVYIVKAGSQTKKIIKR